MLESPKVSDGEVEGFALQKNVLEAVLRQIPLKRRFAKNYNIMRKSSRSKPPRPLARIDEEFAGSRPEKFIGK